MIPAGNHIPRPATRSPAEREDIEAKRAKTAPSIRKFYDDLLNKSHSSAISEREQRFRKMPRSKMMHQLGNTTTNHVTSGADGTFFACSVCGGIAKVNGKVGGGRVRHGFSLCNNCEDRAKHLKRDGVANRESTCCTTFTSDDDHVPYRERDNMHQERPCFRGDGAMHYRALPKQLPSCHAAVPAVCLGFTDAVIVVDCRVVRCIRPNDSICRCCRLGLILQCVDLSKFFVHSSVPTVMVE